MNLPRCGAAVLLASLLAGATAMADEAIVPRAPQFVALSVPDAAKSAAWYQNAFGLRLLAEVRPPDGGGYVIILKSDSLLLEILQARDAKPASAEAMAKPFLVHGLFKVGFQVADLDAAVARLTELGANFETRIIDDTKHDLRFALLRDPDGNYVQLFGTPRPKTSP
jgi:glyoxylase I family protein